MNEVIANIIKTKLEEICYSDKVAGLTRVVAKGDKRFPISCDVSSSDCDKGQYENLVPDDKYKSIIFLREVAPFKMTGKTGGSYHFQSYLEVVTWVNLKRLGYSNCNSVAFLQALMIKKLDSIKKEYFDADGFSIYGVNVSQIQGSEKDAKKVFSQYDYKDIENMALYPYDFFAFRLAVDFNITERCIDECLLPEPIEC